MFFVQTLHEVLDRQLLRWTLRRSSLNCFFALFSPEEKVLRLGGSRVRHWVRTPARPRWRPDGHDDLEFPRLLTWHSGDSCFCHGYVWCVRLDPSCQKFYFFRRDGGGNQWQPPWLPWGGCRPRPLCFQFRLRVNTLRARWLLGLFYSWSSARCSHLATGRNFYVTLFFWLLGVRPRRRLEDFLLFLVVVARAARTWSSGHFSSSPSSWQFCFTPRGFWKNFSHFLRWYVSGLRRMQKYAQLILQLPCLHAVFALGTWTSLLQAARARQ